MQFITQRQLFAQKHQMNHDKDDIIDMMEEKKNKWQKCNKTKGFLKLPDKWKIKSIWKNKTGGGFKTRERWDRKKSDIASRK